MTKRQDFLAGKNAGIEELVAVEICLAESIDPKLPELVKVRVSQMNGCAHCLQMHHRNALKLGETEDRLLLLSAWPESGLCPERERAALAWAEFLTRIAESHAPDAVYEETRCVSSEDEPVALSIGVATINVWNRLAIGFRLQHPADRKRAV